MNTRTRHSGPTINKYSIVRWPRSYKRNAQGDDCVGLLFRTGKACTTIFCAASCYRYNNNHYPCRLKHNHSIFRAILVDKSQLQCTSNVNIITLEFQTILSNNYSFIKLWLHFSCVDCHIQIAKLFVFSLALPVERSWPWIRKPHIVSLRLVLFVNNWRLNLYIYKQL